MSYAEIYKAWQADPEAFWMEASEAIDWVRAPSKALWDEKAPLYEWFKDAQVNTCWNAVCLLYTSPSPRDRQKSRMPSSA